jgi:hypothetical protein
MAMVQPKERITVYLPPELKQEMARENEVRTVAETAPVELQNRCSVPDHGSPVRVSPIQNYPAKRQRKNSELGLMMVGA